MDKSSEFSIRPSTVFVFDFDGTLVLSDEIKLDIFVEISEEYIGAGDQMRDLLNSDFKGTRVDYFNEIVRRTAGLRNLKPNPTEMVEQFTIRCEEEISRCSEVRGASHFLDLLKKSSITSCINSATPGETLTRIIRRRGWSDYFELSLGAEVSKVENIMLIEKQLGVSAKDMIYIGNGGDDLRTAMHFGIPFVAMGTHQFGESDGSFPRYPDFTHIL